MGTIQEALKELRKTRVVYLQTKKQELWTYITN